MFFVQMLKSIILISVIFVLGCNQIKMSLDDANKVALDYQGDNYIPPPRQIDSFVKKIKSAEIGEIKNLAHVCETCSTMDLNAPGILTRIKNLSQMAMVSHWRGNSLQAKTYIKKAIELFDNKKISKYFYQSRRSNFDHVYGSTMYRAGDIYMGSGRYIDAIGFIEKAKEINDNKERYYRGRSVSQNSFLAIAYAEIGDIERAEDAFEEAQDSYADMGFRNERARSHKEYFKEVFTVVNGFIHDARGGHREAETYYRKAIKLVNAHTGKRKVRAWDTKAKVMSKYLVNNLLAQGRIAEAESQLILATDYILEKFGAETFHMGDLLQSYIKVLMQQQRYNDAEILFEVASNVYKKIGIASSSFKLAQLNLLLADIYMSNNKHAAAYKQYLTVFNDLKSDKFARDGLFNNNPNWVLSLVYNKEYNKALKLVDQLIINSHKLFGSDHIKTIEANAIKSMLLAVTGKVNEALSLYDELLPQFIGTQGNGLHNFDGELGTQRLRLILEPLLSVLAARAQNGDQDAAQKAFYMVQLIQGKSVQNAVAASAARAGIKQPEMVSLIRREQNILRKIEASYSQLSHIQSELNKVGDKLRTDIQLRIKKLTAAHRTILDEIHNRYPEYDELVRPGPVNYKDIKAILKKDESLIFTYSGSSEFFLWVVSADKLVQKTHQLSRRLLSDMVSQLREGLDNKARTIDQIPVFDVIASHKLYQLILEPSQSSWIKSKQLIVITDGYLGTLPFSVLVTKAPLKGVKHKGKRYFDEYKNIQWLANSHAISYLPSINALKSLRNNKSVKLQQKPFAGFGNPVFSETVSANTKALSSKENSVLTRGLHRVKSSNASYMNTDSSLTHDMLEALPETEQEIKRIAEVLKVNVKGNVFVGTSANESKVKAMKLNDRRILMFATHALLPGDVDGLTQPAIALSASNKDDGLLTMSEVMALELDADWVVLSACNTGAGSGRGAGAISGLGRAFFYAGTRSLLVSHWAVETTSAMQLTTSLFDNQTNDKELSRTQALAKTMRDVMTGGVNTDEKGKIKFSYAHPVFWAPFTLVGDGS